MTRSGITLLTIVTVVVACPFQVEAAIVLSTQSSATLGGITFEDGDLVKYDPSTDTATLLFDEDWFASRWGEDIKAVTVLSNGNLVLSTQSSARLGGLRFENGDLVEYDPVNETATLFFDEDLFSSGENIDAADVLPNGNIVLSTTGPATLGGLTFRDGDLAEYDPGSDTATLFFDEDLLTLPSKCDGIDIDAVSILLDGHIVLSTKDAASLGGLDFRDGDLAEYDPVSGEATLFFNEDLFDSYCEDIDAVAVIAEKGVIPEPSTFIVWSLLGALAITVGWCRHKRAG